MGVNIFYEILCIGQVKLGKNKPILHKTKLGWVLTGTLFFNTNNTLKDNYNDPTLCNLLITNNDLHRQMERFWLIENCEIDKRDFLPQELACEKHFVQNYKRTSQGRFEVKLPITNESVELGDSKNMATKRFYNLEKRLHRDEILKRDYLNFMSEYEKLGHMSPIDPNDIETTDKTYYLPHHGVIKADSTTTKLRVVYDASAKSDNGMSLNDILMTGPVIQPDLLSIILNFRIHNVVFTFKSE